MFSQFGNSRLQLISVLVGAALLVGIIIFAISSCQSGGASPSTPPVQRAAFPSAYFSPYVDVTTTDNPFSLVTDAQQPANGGARLFTLAFVSASAGCQATWGGMTTLDANHPFLLDEIRRLRAAGGDVTVSFGGTVASQGTDLQDLAQACRSVQSLRAQYQAVINMYQLTHVDFLVEGALLSDAPSIALRNQALVGLHSGVPGQPLSLSFSIPVTPQGLDKAGYAFLQSALQAHVALSTINLLAEPFNSPKTSMSAMLAAIQAKVAQQLLQLEQAGPGRLSISLGITPWIGENSNSTASFTLDDAQQLLAFANAHRPQVSELSMWSLERDRPCVNGETVLVQDRCSGLPQHAYDFTRLFSTFTPAIASVLTPTPTPSPGITPTPTPTPTPGLTPSPPPAPRTGNLLVNPQFDGLTGWNCEASDMAQNHTLRILPTAATDGKCTQVVTGLQPNHTYTFQVYARGSYAYIQVGNQVQSVFSTDYTLLSIPFTTGSQTSVTVALYAGVAQPEVDFQNASLE